VNTDRVDTDEPGGRMPFAEAAPRDGPGRPSSFGAVDSDRFAPPNANSGPGAGTGRPGAPRDRLRVSLWIQLPDPRAWMST